MLLGATNNPVGLGAGIISLNVSAVALKLKVEAVVPTAIIFLNKSGILFLIFSVGKISPIVPVRPNKISCAPIFTGFS